MHTCQRNEAFTLLELLVVISIIALLIGILLPVLSKARDTAWGVRDISNMRQLGIAANLYGNDWDEIIVPGLIFGGGSGSWDRRLAEYLAIEEGAETELLQCPFDDREDVTISGVSVPPRSYVPLRTIAARPNEGVVLGGAQGSIDWSLRATYSNVRQPTQCVFLTELYTGSFANNAQWRDPFSVLDGWIGHPPATTANYHGNANSGFFLAGFLFVDGHVSVSDAGEAGLGGLKNRWWFRG